MEDPTEQTPIDYHLLKRILVSYLAFCVLCLVLVTVIAVVLLVCYGVDASYLLLIPGSILSLTPCVVDLAKRISIANRKPAQVSLP
jgi:hypothetical protein